MSLDCSTIQPYYFISNNNEKTKLNWFTFELACEISNTIPPNIRRNLAGMGHTRSTFNLGCITLAKSLQRLMLERLGDDTPILPIRYNDVAQAFPGLNKKTVSTLLALVGIAWKNLLASCVVCPLACLSNKDEHCKMFDDLFYYGF